MGTDVHIPRFLNPADQCKEQLEGKSEFFFLCPILVAVELLLHMQLSCCFVFFLEATPEEGEELVFTRDVVPFQAVFPYHEYEFGHESRFGLRVYVYDINSGGKSAILRVSAASCNQNKYS